MHSEVEPPPVARTTEKRRFPLRFNTATLLGIMAMVAVVCAVAVAIPWLLAIVASLIATAAMVAYASVLVAGAVVGEGKRRLFAIAALVCLVVSFWTQATGSIAIHLLDRGGLSGSLAGLLWAFIAPVEHIALSLLGGWIALRTARYWRPANP